VLPNSKILGHSVGLPLLERRFTTNQCNFETPGGSSSGCGAGVAAGFAPIAVGSETDGSIIHPATRGSLYGMKCSVGAVPSQGAMPICAAFDGHGVMARTPRDLADLTGILMGGRDFSHSLRRSWDGLRVGFVDPSSWQPTWFMWNDSHEGFKNQTVRTISLS
jgi:amidase